MHVKNESESASDEMCLLIINVHFLITIRIIFFFLKKKNNTFSKTT